MPAAIGVHDLDAMVLRRLKKPFSYETVGKADGTESRPWYFVHDANDDAVCSTYELVYAQLIVNALNAADLSK